MDTAPEGLAEGGTKPPVAPVVALAETVSTNTRQVPRDGYLPLFREELRFVIFKAELVETSTTGEKRRLVRSGIARRSVFDLRRTTFSRASATRSYLYPRSVAFLSPFPINISRVRTKPVRGPLGFDFRE